MLQVKGNYKGMHNNTTCTLCGEKEETQEHILEECIDLNENEQDKIIAQDIFETDTRKLRIIANRIIKK